ncbi:ring finger domain-containing protein [Rutstroemia sp. NJR-2017a BVV2]|nr:ring finger domain-containing protein [Rutstroemia sp. NJR-2017a BVV2]
MARRLVILEQTLPKEERRRLQRWLSTKTRSDTLPLSEFMSAIHRQESENSTLQDAQPSPSAPQVKAELRECSVCAEDLEDTQFPSETCTNTCEHAITICIDCHTRSLNQQIADQSWDRIACPECSSLLSFTDVQKFASTDDFELYDKKALMSLIRQDPNFTHCLGGKCESGQLHDGGNDQPIMTCNSCGAKTCFKHKLPWHTGLTCTEFDEQQRQRLEQEVASVQFMQANNLKQCPNPKSGLRLDKIDGCDHITSGQRSAQADLQLLPSESAEGGITRRAASSESAEGAIDRRSPSSESAESAIDPTSASSGSAEGAIDRTSANSS